MRTFTRLLGIAAALSVIFEVAHAQDHDRIAQWREDIAYYHSALEDRHINLYHAISKESFTSELDRLSDAVPDLADDEIVFEMMRITRLIDDGHTQFPIMGGPHQHFPVRFRLFDSEIRVEATSDQFSDMLGAKLVAIDGTPVDDILRILRPVAQPAENAYGLLSSLALHLTVDELLYAAGITSKLGEATFTFDDKSGARKAYTMASVPMAEFAEATKHRIRPLHAFTEADIVLSDQLWLQTDRATQTAYLYFAGYPSFDEMLTFAAQVRERLDADTVNHLIIDLRDNGGGDFYLGLVLSSEILLADTIDWQNGVYILVGRHTFSAAMSNAVQFRQILNGLLVGEPTGGNPVAYAEGDAFHLPHSGRMVMYSKRLYRFQDQSTEGVQPDILVETSVDSFLSGADPEIDWVLGDIARNDR